MATTFADVLKSKAAVYEASTKKNQELINEWTGAVQELFLQLREWLGAADPSGDILTVETTEAVIREPNVGRYKMPQLEIRAFDNWVGIIPKARKTIRTDTLPGRDAPQRATGRVDITDEVTRYCLYRFNDGNRNHWWLDFPMTNDLRPLTPETFDVVIKSFFE